MKRPDFLTLGFWRGASQGAKSPLALTHDDSVQDLRQKLIGDFQRARFGVTFRSQSFPGLIAGEREYYRALATSIDMGQWDIHRIVERPTQMESSLYPVATPHHSMRVVKSGLGFFDALEHVARFETTREHESLAPDIRALGAEHYVAFALLHDIVFDLHGMPQPTIAGHVALSGDYPDTMLQDLKIARQNTGGKAVMEQKALQDAHRQSSDVLKGFKATLRFSEGSNDLNEMNGLVEFWLVVLGDCWKGKDFCLPYEQDSSYYLRLAANQINDTTLSRFRWDWGFGERVYSLYKNSVEIIGKLNDVGVTERKIALGLLKECATLALVQDAKYLASKLDKTIGATPDPKTMKWIEGLADQNTQINFGPIQKTMSFGIHREGFIARAMSEAVLKTLPPHYFEVLDALRGVENGLRKEAALVWQGIRPPQP